MVVLKTLSHMLDSFICYSTATDVEEGQDLIVHEERSKREHSVWTKFILKHPVAWADSEVYHRFILL